MALLWIDGFEKYGSVNSAINPTDIVDWKYCGHYDELINVQPGRNGGNCIRLDSSSTYLVTPALPMGTSRTLLCGFAFKMTNLTANETICDFRNPNMYGETLGYGQCELKVDGGGNGSELKFVVGNTQKAVSTTANLQTDTWYYLEMKVYCDDSSGTANVCIDGTEVISFSGDTRHRSAVEVVARYDRVLWHINAGEELFIDDLFIANDVGSGVTDFLGDCRVETLSPTSTVSGNWSASTGNTLWSIIDEDQLDANYIKDDTTGNQALFEVDNLSATAATGTIQGVMLCADSQQSTQGMKQYAKAITQNGSGGTIQDTGNFVPGITNPLCFTVMMENDPDGNDWTAATVNQLRIGVEVAEDGS